MRLIILAVALVCAGCLPTRRQDTLTISGAVVNAATQQPVVGARLHYVQFPEHVVYTGVEGCYAFPAISHFGFVMLLPMNRVHHVQTITVDAAGYVTTNVPVCGLVNTNNHLVFHLQPE